MTSTVRGWYINGVDFETAPSSRRELSATSIPVDVAYSELLRVEKWEHLLRGKRADIRRGWVQLGDIAKTRRGIATGANDFFLVSAQRLLDSQIPFSSVLPCVGRANDVSHYDFKEADFAELTTRGAKNNLLNFSEKLSPSEAKYVEAGYKAGLHKRYLLANRTPWYSMEQRPVAPIWASVFGRGDLRFVYNSAQVRSLTNFHCIYTAGESEAFNRALVFCLNMPSVRLGSALHMRSYGGGLLKFEPNDLREIQIPDIRRISPATLENLALGLDELDKASRRRVKNISMEEWDRLVVQAGAEAGGSTNNLFE